MLPPQLSRPQKKGRAPRINTATQRKEYPPPCNGVSTHMEQGHYTESRVEGMWDPNKVERKRVAKLWRSNRGCQYQTILRPQTAKFAKTSGASVVERPKRWPLNFKEYSSPSPQRRAASTLDGFEAYDQSPSVAPRKAKSRPHSAISTLNHTKNSRIPQREHNLRNSGFNLDGKPFKSYGAQGGKLTRLMSAKGSREMTPKKSSTRRPASAQYIPESREPGQSFSAVGQHQGTLDKTSVLRMKVNLAFTQPQIPPPTPMLTGKAATARERNDLVENPPPPKKEYIVKGNLENIPFS